MSDQQTPAEKPKGFEMFDAMMNAFTWSAQNIGKLIQLTWFSVVIYLVAFLAIYALVFVGLFSAGVFENLGENLDEAESMEQTLEAISAIVAAYSPVILGAYLLTYFIVCLIIAVPVRAATELAQGGRPQAFLGLFYFQMGNKELRIAFYTFTFFLVMYTPMLLLQFAFWDELVSAMVMAMENIENSNDPAAMREMIRIQSIYNGISLLSMLVMGYFAGRLITVVPAIVEGGEGFGIRQAWALTKGHGLTMLIYLVIAFIALYLGLLVLMMIAAIPLVILSVIFSAAGGEVAMVLFGIAIFIFFMLAFPALLYGFMQKLQVNAHEWLKGRQASDI